MKIIRHTARDMRQALRAVREQLGEDAVILSSRKTSEGVEVTAAVDFDAATLEGSGFANAPEPLPPPRIIDATPVPMEAPFAAAPKAPRQLPAHLLQHARRLHRAPLLHARQPHVTRHALTHRSAPRQHARAAQPPIVRGICRYTHCHGADCDPRVRRSQRHCHCFDHRSGPAPTATCCPSQSNCCRQHVISRVGRRRAARGLRRGRDLHLPSRPLRSLRS